MSAPARVVLLGFMAAGKTTVGRRLAERLGWDFVDFDREVERRSGRTIGTIFRESGEDTFREREGRLTDEYADSRCMVLAPGGGWITTPGAVESLGAETLCVWLRISAKEAVRRAAADAAEPGSVVRPLLAGEDPLRDAERILEERAPLYRRVADLRLDVGGREIDDIVAEIVDHIRDLRDFDEAPELED